MVTLWMGFSPGAYTVPSYGFGVRSVPGVGDSLLLLLKLLLSSDEDVGSFGGSERQECFRTSPVCMSTS